MCELLNTGSFPLHLNCLIQGVFPLCLNCLIEFSAAFEQLDTELSHALFTHLEELPDEGPECSFLTFLAGGPSPSAFRFVAETKPAQDSPQKEALLILTIRLHNYVFIQKWR